MRGRGARTPRKGSDMATNEAGTVLTCGNGDCGCRLRIEQPCPHGDTYTCACGHPLEAAGGSSGADAAADRSVEAVEAADQQMDQRGGVRP